MFKIVVGLCVLGVVFGGPPVSKSREEIEKFKEYLEKSRRDDGVLLSQRMEENPKASVWENSGKYQGDILLDDEQVEGMITQYAQGRHAFIWPNTRWPVNTVVYEFGSGEFNNAQRNAILNSIRDLERNTCIRFRTRTASDRNFVRLTGKSDGCYAHVGFGANRGVHTMNLARNTPGRGCFNHVVIIHEWLHVIGFFHMQSTHNRYDYVRINWNNIVAMRTILIPVFDCVVHRRLEVSPMSLDVGWTVALSKALMLKVETSIVYFAGGVNLIQSYCRFAISFTWRRRSDGRNFQKHVYSDLVCYYRNVRRIKAVMAGVSKDMAFNFDRYGTNMVSNLGFPYEYGSCMHYGAFAFSRNGQPTITATRPTNAVMGQTSVVTRNDYARVSRHYGCI